MQSGAARFRTHEMPCGFSDENSVKLASKQAESADDGMDSYFGVRAWLLFDMMAAGQSRLGSTDIVRLLFQSMRSALGGFRMGDKRGIVMVMESSLEATEWVVLWA